MDHHPATTTDLHVDLIRSELAHVEAGSSVTAAAAVGGHLEEIARTFGPSPSALDAVRDASFRLLMDLVRSGDVVSSRRAALASVDELATGLTSLGATSGRAAPARAAL